MPLPLSGLDALMQGSTIRHLLIAAKSGDAAAQFNLGVLYDSRLDDNGYAIEGNRAEAMKWLLAAAEQGLPRAQSLSSPRCTLVSQLWQKTSSMLVPGSSWRPEAHAASIHRHRARSGYERISVRLTPAQLARAKRLAGDWQPKKPNKTAPVRSPKLS